MTRRRAFPLVALALCAAVALAVIDLELLQQETLVIYTTPALRDLVEKFIVPRFRSATGVDVALVYVSAGQQYTRLELSGSDPDADLFLHASPLFLEKGFEAGRFAPYETGRNATIPPAFKSRPVSGGFLWYAFAWSPLVEVYDLSFAGPPDLESIDTSFGFPDPVLSNNGIYAVLFFETLSPGAGARALAHTIVQPTNARATIVGVAEDAFDVALGYEAVTLFFLGQGAQVAFDLPVLQGQHIVTPVMFSAGLVRAHPHPRALDFIDFLFRDDVQRDLHRFYFRSVLPGFPDPSQGVVLPAPGAVTLVFDWALWRDLEAALPKYVISG